MRAFALSTLLSALLLFTVEPLIGRALLPWFGGMPSVWSACLLFFQLSLLGGYAYSHLLVSRLAPRAQLKVHLVVLAAALVVLGGQTLAWGVPVLPGLALKPGGSDLPVPRLLVLLALTVGLPFFVLSTTGPLAQGWLARAEPRASTYRLYALSNGGSLIGLLGYPLLVEPHLTLKQQAWAWVAVFGLFVVAVLGMAKAVARAPSPVTPEAPVVRSPVRAGDFVGWAALASVPSIMLLAVTNQLCQEVAVSPLLWVLPLAAYLLSFVLTFESARWYSRRLFLVVLIPLLVVGFVVITRQGKLPLSWQVIALLAVLFVASMFCHGELAHRRPPVQQLTTFYLAVSLGGALGAILVPLVAPLVFSNYFELDASLVLVWLAAIAVLFSDETSAFHGSRRKLARVGAAAYLYVLLALVGLRVFAWDENTVAVRRSFYGILRVVRECKDPERSQGCVMTEMNGGTFHGLQVLDDERRREATTYFAPSTGIGRAIANHPARLAGRPMRVGVVGLGVGTLATYGQAGDLFRFYEINPDAIELARAGSPYFTYLADTPATVEMVAGDARLSLEHELATGAPQGFDLLVVDAFSSDAIPAHLLTHEALQLYRAHLAGAESILAMHVSNRNLDLAPLVWSLAERSGLACRDIFTVRPSAASNERDAEWMLLSETPAVLDAPGIVRDGKDLFRRGRTVRPWTDDFTNVLSLLL